MRRCDVDKCNRRHEARGLCAAHYQRLNRTGDVGSAEIQGAPTKCNVDKCDRMASCKGYCGAHYRRWHRTGDPGPAAIRPPRRAKTYVGMHLKVARERGKATGHECARCGQQADDWAYDHSDPDERYRKDYGSPFSLDVDHYMPLCRLCHIEFDQDHAPLADEVVAS